MTQPPPPAPRPINMAGIWAGLLATLLSLFGVLVGIWAKGMGAGAREGFLMIAFPGFGICFGVIAINQSLRGQSSLMWVIASLASAIITPAAILTFVLLVLR